MALLRQLIQSSYKKSTFSPLFLGHHFSTVAEQPHFDPFGAPSQGVVYAKLVGINENTLKTDIINIFDTSKLTLDDIKVEYDRLIYPVAMWLKFPSLAEFSAAIRENSRKGRYFRLEKVDSHYWDAVVPQEGNNVLLQGIPRMANIDDVERFLAGCNFNTFEIFSRSAYPEPMRMARVSFPSRVEAMNAVIQKNGSFCLNNRIVTRYLQ